MSPAAHAAASVKAGDLILGTLHNGMWVDPNSHEVAYLTSGNQRFGTFILVAAGLNGGVFVADNYFAVDDFNERPSIVHVDPATEVATLLATNFGHMSGIARDRDGTLLVLEREARRIVRFNASTGARTTVTSGGKLIAAGDLAVEPGGSILTTAAVSSEYGPRQVIRIRAGTGVHEVLATGGLLINPQWITAAPNGVIYVSDMGGNITPPRIIRIDPNSGAQWVATEWPGSSIGGVFADATGSFYVGVIGGVAGGGLFRVNPATGARTNVAGNGPTYSIYPPGKLDMMPPGGALGCPSQVPVRVTTTNLGGGRLRVDVHAEPAFGVANAIQSIQFGSLRGASVEGQPAITGADATFVVQRTAPGAVTVPFTVRHVCGDWPTFVGGGPSAF